MTSTELSRLLGEAQTEARFATFNFGHHSAVVAGLRMRLEEARAEEASRVSFYVAKRGPNGMGAPHYETGRDAVCVLDAARRLYAAGYAVINVVGEGGWTYFKAPRA